MDVHIIVCAADAARRERFTRALASLQQVRVTADTPGRLWRDLNRGDVDLVLVDEASLTARPETVVASIRKVPEQPEVIAIQEREDGVRRSHLLAAGCLAALPAGLEASALREALAALIERRRRDQSRSLAVQERMRTGRLEDFVSESPVMQQFMDLARRVVASDSSLLLLGETGVGKERLARAIHAESARSGGPFVGVNCAALPETLLESELFGHERGAFTGATRTRRGYFELAQGGTVFLDEIAEMPHHLQAKLLRVLEERAIQRLGGEAVLPINVRLMAATNRDLEAEVAAGRFRADLYYRLAVVTLRLPSLRERREDIPGLVASYLDHFGAVLGGRALSITPRALAALVGYDWPGNVRELINIVERTTLIAPGEIIDLADLPDGVSAAVPSPPDERPAFAADVPSWRGRTLPEVRDELLARFHREYLGQVLAAHGGRIGDSARAAGVTERTLYALMKRYGLRKEDYKEVSAP